MVKYHNTEVVRFSEYEVRFMDDRSMFLRPYAPQEPQQAPVQQQSVTRVTGVRIRGDV